MQTQQHAPACTRQRMLRTAQLAIAGAALRCSPRRRW